MKKFKRLSCIFGCIIWCILLILHVVLFIGQIVNGYEFLPWWWYVCMGIIGVFMYAGLRHQYIELCEIREEA